MGKQINLKGMKWFYIIDVVLILLVVVALVSMWIIAKGSYTDKPQWLLLPMTGIYVIVSFYMAAGAIAAAKASQKSAEVLEETLGEMRVTRRMQYSPYFSFPQGYVVAISQAGKAEIDLMNLHSAPILGLQVMLWEMEETPSGRAPRSATMWESAPTDYPADRREFRVSMERSMRTDEEKYQIAHFALQEFEARFKAHPQYSICVFSYGITGETQRTVLLFDMTITRAQA